MKKKLLPLTAAAVAVLVVISLPPARLSLATPVSDGTVPGIIHVHTNRSDGRGTPDEVAAAASRAGLKFVVLTDHGDATRKPDPPVYRSGVLCLDAVEISTTGGHYLALDMPQAPYPLGGEARDVVEDVKRLGGFGVVAHPDSPKPALSWRAWDTPFDGIEWVNLDTSWRMRVGRSDWRARWNLLAALVAYPFRPAETMARLVGGTTLDQGRWNSIAHLRQIVTLAAADAHARLAFGSVDPGDNSFSLPIPGYEATFRSLSVHVQLESALSGDAARDAAAVMHALRRGHAYTAVDGLASPPTVRFTASNQQRSVGEGDVMPEASATLRVSSNAPPSFDTVIWEDDRVLVSRRDQTDFTLLVDRPAVYRVEIDAPSKDGPLPWVMSNPIYLGLTFPPAPPRVEPPAPVAHSLFDGRTASGWRVESDPTSVAALDVAPATGGGELRMRYGLSGGTPTGQYVALAVGTPTGEPYDRLTFSARSERPLRLDLQLRGRSGARWHRSVYVEQSNRDCVIEVADMVPVGPAPSPRPVLADVRDVLFVIDTTHTKPGSSGRLWIKSPVLKSSP